MLCSTAPCLQKRERVCRQVKDTVAVQACITQNRGIRTHRISSTEANLNFFGLDLSASLTEACRRRFPQKVSWRITEAFLPARR